MSLMPASTYANATPDPATVLVVDDEPNNCDVLTMLLSAQGFQVVTAADGDTALELVAASPPDAIVLDVMMPTLNGFEVCQQLKTQPTTVHIPVILLTALHNTRDRIHGAAAGADDFISKPFDEVELTTRLRSLLRIKALHNQLEFQNRELELRVLERTAELQKALADLQELDRLKSQFISNVSHELRTPLMHVKSCVQLLADEIQGPLTSPQLQSVHLAQTAIGQLENIVLDVVDFGESRRQLTLGVVDLLEICQIAQEAATPRAAQQRIAVALALAPDLPRVLANRSALLRILRHLLDNAIKFSPPESQVTLSAETLPQHVRLCVEDHGCGMSNRQMDHMFEAFYQGDGAATRRANGLGIGLSVVKKLADAHGTQVRAESRLGQGSRFYFDLRTVCGALG